MCANDFSKIVALKYEGDYYYKQDPQTLTANPSDVTNGKTFIGSSGYPELGTRGMEVESNE